MKQKPKANPLLRRRAGSRTTLVDLAIAYYQKLGRKFPTSKAASLAFRRAYQRSRKVYAGEQVTGEIIDPKVLALAIDMVERERIARLKTELEYFRPMTHDR